MKDSERNKKKPKKYMSTNNQINAVCTYNLSM